jgi:hypothetical protein
MTRSLTHVRPRLANTLAWLVAAAAAVVAVILAAHVVFSVFQGNENNAIVAIVSDVANQLAWKFRNLFVPEDDRIRVVVNYGLAAIVYLIVGQMVAGLVRRIG